MRKWFTRGLVFAGIVSLPVAVSPRQQQNTEMPNYRQDPRWAALLEFFRLRDCPAQHYARAFLETADAYALDWRLLPSISYVESTGGKNAPNNNFFGWDSGRAQFSSPAEGIEAVGYRLSHSVLYRDKDVDEILTTYNPNIEYAQKVKSVMRRIAPSE